MKPIYADLMKSDNEGRLILACYGTHRDLEEQGIALQEGIRLTFYNEDEDNEGNEDNLVIQGIIERDEKNARWTARIIWDEIKNMSQLSQEEKIKLGIE